MKKDEKKITQLFEADASQNDISQEKKEQAINRLLSEARMAAKETVDTKENMTLVSCFDQLLMHLKYMDKKLYQLQIIIVFTGIFLNIVLLKNVFLQNLFFYRNYEERIYVNVIVSSTLFSTVAVIACNIGDRHGMAELSGSCFFNQRQVCVLRLLLSGAVSFVAIGALLCVVRGSVGRPLWEIGIYMLVPYFVTGCVQFILLQINILGRSQYVLWGGGLIMAAMFGTIALEKEIYTKTFIGVWIFIMVLSGVVMAYALYSLLSKIEKGDLLCIS